MVNIIITFEVWPEGNMAITFEYDNLYCIIDAQRDDWLKDKMVKIDINKENYTFLDMQDGNCIIYRGEYDSDWYGDLDIYD